MDDEREPSSRQGSGSADRPWESTPWNIVDDIEELVGEPAAPRPATEHSATWNAPRDRQSSSQDTTWDPSGTAETWNGIPAAPPGSGAVGAGGPASNPSARGSRSASGATGGGSGTERPSEGQTAGPTGGRTGSAGGWNAFDAGPRTPSGTWPGNSAPPHGGSDSGGEAASADTAQQTWFIDDEDEDQPADIEDGATGGSARRALTDRLPDLGAANLGAASIVTLAVILAGVTLVVCSVIWHAHAP